MPSPLTLHPHQEESLAHAKGRNTIINLETGRGKTLIAVKLIEHYLKEKPGKLVAFMVPTRPLVEQQSKYCIAHCRLPSREQSPVVQTLVGEDQSQWTKSEWDESALKSHIFLGTPAIFVDAFVKTKSLVVDQFSLIIFDECHNASGNSPMAQVMRDSVAPFYHSCASDDHKPRILGLTASFINGTMKNIEKKRRNLEALMLSTIFCPKVPARTTDDNFLPVQWTKHIMEDEVKDIVEKHVQETVKQVNIKDIRKVVNKCVHVMEQLGSKAVRFYIEKVIVAQVKAKAGHLLEQSEDGANRLSTKLMHALPSLQASMGSLGQSLDTDPTFSQAPATTLKIDELIRLLRKEFASNPDHRGLIFVQQIALVSAMAKVLNDAMATIGVKCGAVAGTGSQTELERQKHLDMFRKGELRLLAATAALEEGIDVSECAFVVRFSSVTTTKAHIQGAGRARKENCRIYYFENDPAVERQKEASLIAAASNMDLNMSQAELQKAVTSNMHPYHPRHPFPFRSHKAETLSPNEGEISIYNCKQIFNTYVSIALGRSVSLEKELYRFEEHAEAFGSPRRLAAIRSPSPTGWLEWTYNDDYRPWWGQDPPETIFDNDRLKHKSASEKEEMAFVYFVCVMMSSLGHLDSHNQPSALVKTDAKRNCPLDPDWSKFEEIGIKNTIFQSY